MLTRVLPLNQVVIGFPHREKFLKEDVDPSKTLELIKEIIEYLAAVKEIDEDLVIRATAFNSIKYLPKIKIINENVEALKKSTSEQQSEREKEFQYLSEVFDTTSNDIIQEYEKEIESLKDKLQRSECKSPEKKILIIIIFQLCSTRLLILNYPKLFQILKKTFVLFPPLH